MGPEQVITIAIAGASILGIIALGIVKLRPRRRRPTHCWLCGDPLRGSCAVATVNDDSSVPICRDCERDVRARIRSQRIEEIGKITITPRA